MQINRQNSPLFAEGKAKWDKFVAGYKGPYGLKDSVYAGMNQKVSFVCPTHGVMDMDAKNMMASKKCKLCAFEERRGKYRVTQKKMLAKFQEVHGSKYDYSQAVYAGTQTPVKIICPEHGMFAQAPEVHWKGSRCPQCFHEQARGASQRDTKESFAQKVQAIFGDLFDLSQVEYTNSQTPVTVRCTKHDRLFSSKPNALTFGYNPCTQCNHMKSAAEDEMADYLSTFAPIERRDRALIKPRELDIYIPSMNVAVEYCGMYHHSCKTDEEVRKNKNKHHEKYVAAQSKGVRVLTVYETEWKERQPQIKRLLRNLINKSKGRLMARKCRLDKVDKKEAMAFFEKYHVQGGAGFGEHYGLFWGNKLVACMRFTFGINDRGVGAKNAAWTLSRYATRINVSGGASRLFKAFVDEHKPKEVKSFSDNRYFDGGMYEKLGFSMEKELDPDYQVWSPKIGLKPKSHYQRRAIPARLKDHGMTDIFDPENDTRSESEMTFFMNCGRIYDCGKKRWLWSLDTLAQQE
jgi:hypothetical protein